MSPASESHVIEAVTELSQKFDQHFYENQKSWNRIDIIENRINQLAEAVISIARAEEKIGSLILDSKDIKSTIYTNRDKLHLMEITVAMNSADIASTKRFFWLLATVVASVAASWLAYLLEVFSK